ncbi:MAG TPA: hypothetical protein VL053_19765 [Arachidicoccus sp.]|nr:hypothetical protein [Arachidicoccus sp.]
MKKIILGIIAGISLFSASYAQDIKNYVLPNGVYNALNEDAQKKMMILSNEINRGEDPSFESVSSVFPHYMDYPKAIVGIKEHHGRFLSSWDGAIIFPPFYLALEVVGEGRKMFTDPIPFSDPKVKKLDNSLVGDYLPVINREFEYEGMVYQQTIFAYAEDFSTESPLIAFVRMKVKNTENRKKENILSISFKGTGARPASQIWATSGRDIINSPMMLYSKSNTILNENGDAIFWTGGIPDGEFGENRISFNLSLAANEEKELYFCTPFEPIRESRVLSVSKQSFDETYNKVQAYWSGIIKGGMQINVPEKIVNDAYKTWHINNFLLVQEDSSRLTYKTTDAPFFYEGIFGYAAAMYLNTITTAGYYEEAKKCASMFLRLQSPDGSISGVNRSNGIIPHQHGGILYAISQIYRKGRDKTWFADVAPDLIKGCDWIIRERSKTRILVDGKKTVTYGLLPPYRSNVDNGHGTQEYIGNSWCWAALNQVSIALIELGGDFKSQGIRLQKEAAAFRADLFASMEKATIRENGLSFLPMDIATKKPFENITDNGEAVYYGMLSCRMLESEIFDTNDERLNWIPEFLEKRSGIMLGLTRMEGQDQMGYTAHFSGGYGITNVRLNKIDRSLMNFYGMLSYGMARNLYATQEHDNFIVGKNDPWYYARQPHLHSTAELIRITNTMLIHEERKDLWLAYGVPKKWLEDGKTIEVRNAQTCFGPVTYNIHSNAAQGMIKADISCAPTIFVPSNIKLKFRHPDGKPIARVEVNGKPWKDHGEEIINLTGTNKKYTVVAYY